MKKTKKLIALVLAMITVFTAMSFSSVNASAANKGRTGSSTYCKVVISKSLINKAGRQYATVKLNTGTAANIFNTGKKVLVTLKDGNGRFITKWTAKGGDTLKLGDDYSVYRIYVDYAETSFSGVGNSYNWKITNAKNCTIS
ncbi:MAG: hypothetical protein IJU39_03560 [Clostridia bacterium]|nr:hypothetical protein [Clostridia bacterium]